ncbi:MAG: tRNA (N(6)-L-threonylcarbamoyladenosine(37)-C(2))-methylthiotransferase MtaB [Deltaproteobacteria bacterium]|nr:tRNA (N(6)-L-threonylcarbamoyladenosine(37)-C(2))-methylthiotransferase MtaB [Deltaproteobacteria bacterium]MBW2318294.1 tRNA (N(6)-L-threonylcarbamoyladenosine(37)-C(2))-methylthiotransferase MtaB [Deltaproteobacteria bacterium]MBW2600495.1 tRNA (N(6)-L-threonylcarbamoyladenosine(37)-C(2))-methylthiotransferase MtaB [Deltaproteobacteria bacterium]
MKSFVITTLGCKVNRYESEAISEGLSSRGWHRAEKGAGADLCIINTCMVTGKAATQSRQAVRQSIRSHKGSIVTVTGCHAQVAPEVFASIPDVRYVVGNSFKDRIPRLAEQKSRLEHTTILVEDLARFRLFQDLSVTRFGKRTRCFVKIQDGCDAFCSYCIIPYARGRSRSLRPEIVIDRINRLKAQGYLEAVLCGIHMGRYGQDLDPVTSLMDLIRSVEILTSIPRLRLSSIEPRELSEELIRYLANSGQTCPHLHIPLQSGDDEILKAMKRPYTSKFFEELIDHITHNIRHVAIGVDLLVGFPGETERAFENTCRLIERLAVAYLHVFPFSPQAGTPAEAMENRVRPEIVKRRCQYLRRLSQIKRRKFNERFVGSIAEVLIEEKRDTNTGYFKGFTKNYIPVFVKGSGELLNQIVEVKIDRIEKGRVFAEP